MNRGSSLQPLAEPGQRHLLHQMVQFSQALRTSGLAVSPSRLIDLCRCMRFIDIRHRPDFYVAARANLVASHEDVPVFDQTFREFWDRPGMLNAPEPDSSESPNPEEPGNTSHIVEQVLPRFDADGDPQQVDPSEAPPGYSLDEAFMKRDLRLMSDQELEKARKLVSELIATLANHSNRRTTPSAKGNDLDLRRMLRRNALRAGDGTEFRYRKKQIKRTRLLVLCDVSGSMEHYSNFFIPFIYALRQKLSRLEVAVFSTRTTVITDALRRQSVEQSLAEVAEQVHDWGGGTDIGRCLQEFNHRFRRGAHCSHAVAIILSDGWDRGEPSRMREEMKMLKQGVHKVLWLNPLLGDDDYQPLCQGMRTALPFIDHFLPAHNLESFAELVRRLRTLWR